MAHWRRRLLWLPLVAVAAAGAFAFQSPTAASRLVERCTVRLGEGADAVALSGEGHCIAVADNQNHQVKLLEAGAMPSGGGKEVPLASLLVKRTLTGFQQPLLALAFSPDGRLLATGAVDGSLQLWECESGRVTQTWAGHQGVFLGLAFSPDGTLLACAGEDRTTRVWEVATGKQLATLTGHVGEVIALAFSPRGDALATAGSDADIRVWDAHSGMLRRTFTELSLATVALVYAADGKTLYAGGVDKTISILDVATGKIRKRLAGSADVIVCLALTGDNRLLVSGGANAEGSLMPAQLLVWDVASGRVIQRLRRPAVVSAVGFSANGRALLTCGGSGNSQTATVWEAR